MTPAAPSTAATATEPAATATAASSERSPRASSTKVRYSLEGVEIRGNTRTTSRVVLRYVKFRAGDVLDVDDPELTLVRYRLLGTGFFSSVQLSLRKGKERGSAILVIDVVERNTLILQGLWLGIAADEDTAGNSKPNSPFLGAQVAETNLLGSGITVGAGIGIAADQLALRARFFDPAFLGTGWSAQVTALYTDARDFFGNKDVLFEASGILSRQVPDYAVVAYRRAGASLGTGHDLGVSTQFSLDYRLEQIEAVLPKIASHVRGNTREPIEIPMLPGKSALSALRATIAYDTRDLPFLTTRGTFAQAAITAGLPPIGSSYGFAKVELSYQKWWRLPWKHVVRFDAFVGGIGGDAPFFEKFYVGDFTDLLPDRVLDLAPDRRQPPNYLSTDIVEVRYGDFAARLDLEYRVPVYTGKGSIYGVDLFGRTGIYCVASQREFTDPPSGYQGAARVPIDLTYNVGLRVDTSIGGITLAFSNLLGLLPARGGERK
ncbi:MAG: BamA/TamA family outer membrane protein [Polyangiaceae bacterium]|nr:BamA/TamA family outer membrane protein [Polyangiaceae bacterium]